VVPCPPVTVRWHFRDARRFARQFVGLVAACLLLQAGFNYLVNPWGIYAPRLVEARVLDERGQKCALLRQFRPPPAQLVLGSSRVMRFEPAYLEQRTGLRTFNLAVPSAAPVDCLALYRYATEAVKAPVRSVLLGVDTRALFGRDSNFRELAANRELRPFLPARGFHGWDLRGVPLLLNWTQTAHSAAAVRHAFWGAKRTRERALAADGLQLWNMQDEERARPGWSLARSVREQLAGDYLDPGEIDLNPDALRELGLFLALTQRQGVRTTVLLTPALDAVHLAWRHSGFAPRERTAAEQVRALCDRYGARFLDLSTVASFDGDPQEFYDGVHPAILNTRRMIDTLLLAPGRQHQRQGELHSTRDSPDVASRLPVGRG
jgi:hypothetical protein